MENIAEGIYLLHSSDLKAVIVVRVLQFSCRRH
jgi:hypothetical protein